MTETRFGRLSNAEVATLPEGYAAPLDTRTTRQLIAERTMTDTPTPEAVGPMMDDDMEAGALCAVRERLTNGLGVVVAFIDDHAGLAVLLAQRAVLAGLASDADPETLTRLAAAAEPHRSKHEKALGRPIAPALPAPRRYTGGPLEDGLYLWRRQMWPAIDAQVVGIVGDEARFGTKPPKSDAAAGGAVWLTGPIHIPDPEEEAANG